jgi:hypothetical protein
MERDTGVRRSLRTPRAAGIAGVLFGLLLTAALVLVRLGAPGDPADVGAGLADPGRRRLVMLALNLVPFAGIAFLWFIGVVRDRIGPREDRFFATVFLGSGLLFVGMLFVATGVATGVLADAAARPGRATDGWVLGQRIGAVIMHTYAMRMSAVFTISTAAIGLRTGFVPRWLGFSGYAVAVILLLGIGLTRWVEVLFPFWILLLSLHILLESLKGSQRDPLGAARGAPPAGCEGGGREERSWPDRAIPRSTRSTVSFRQACVN